MEVTQVKTEDTDGYNSMQLGFDDAKEKRTTKAMMGYFNNAKSILREKLWNSAILIL